MSSVTERVATLPGGGRLRPLAATFAYYGAFIGLGLISSSLGPTLPALASQTNTELREISFLFTTRATGYMVGSLLGGRLYDRMAGHPVMALSLLVMAVGMVSAPLLPLLWTLALVLFAIGIGEGVVDVGGNALVVWIHRARVGPFMNALHFFFGVGAFLSPIVIAQAVLATGGIRWGYWLLALYVVPIGIWLLRLHSPRHEAAHVTGQRRAIPVNWRLLSLIMTFMFVYVGAEVGVGGWLYTYAVEMGLANTTAAAYLTSVYWGAFMLGRLLSIPIAARVRPRTILMVDLAGCVLNLSLMVLLPESAWSVWVGAFGVGLFIASIFPTVITWAERRMSMSGVVTSMFLVGSSLGAMLIPWLIGQLFDRYGPGITMPTILVTVLISCVILVILMVYGGAPKLEADETV
ncbi:MAG: MFS transporter [Caldilineaceae bacterium]|nr:MFS transporter [Caldilineaceae bacterium]